MNLRGGSSYCFLAVAFFILQAVPYSFTEQVVVEVPGYAKSVLGGYGNLGTAYFEPHRPFYSFRSIYYAAKPTNETRFLPPVTSNYPYPDDEIVNAINFPPGCPQGGSYHGESCLILSIYTPYLPKDGEKPLPVMYWIHGGSFDSGQNIIYQPNTYMSYDVVLVEVQYRLGPLGYLTLDTDEIPGNAGMFDQIEGLRWVNKFIQYFGGDPNAVTIIGESAGAASVNFLLLAPQARGLFRYVIAESGSMLTEWALDRKGGYTGYRIAEYAGCPMEPYEALLNCLRNIDEVALHEAQRMFSREDYANNGLGFGGQSPVIQVAGKERALVREPKEILLDGDYPTDAILLMGANKHEGLYCANFLYSHYIRPFGLADDEEYLTNDLVPTILSALGTTDESGALSEAMTKKYLGYALDQGLMGNWTAMIPGLIDMTGTLFLKAGGWETTRLHTKHNPGNAYWYHFGYRTRWDRFLDNADNGFPPGVDHAHEIMFLWTMPFRYNESEAILAKRMTTIWTSFATYGKPTPIEVPVDGVPNWEPYNPNDEFYMDIDTSWQIKQDFTETYTVYVDEMILGKNNDEKSKSSENNEGVPPAKEQEKVIVGRRRPEESNY